MAQIFHRSANTLSRVTIFGAVFIVAFVLWVIGGIVRAVCHGRIDKMPLTYQAAPLTMSWCLNCHRNPEQYVRPRDQVFNMAYVTDKQDEIGPRLVAEYKIQKLTSCSTCHY